MLKQKIGSEFCLFEDCFQCERGLQQGRQEERRSLISLLLKQKIGELPSALHDRIAQLNLAQLEALAIALLHFSALNDLEIWLEGHRE
jgi:hypothetical protein